MWVLLEFFTYVEIWLLLNGGPLSEINLCESPCSENIFSSSEIIQLADVDDTISTTGQRESIATNKYFEFGSGLGKSMFIVCHEYGGRVEGSNGCGVGLFDTVAHKIHSYIFAFTLSSILRK